jgi:hypothetical protein
VRAGGGGGDRLEGGAALPRFHAGDGSEEGEEDAGDFKEEDAGELGERTPHGFSEAFAAALEVLGCGGCLPDSLGDGRAWNGRDDLSRTWGRIWIGGSSCFGSLDGCFGGLAGSYTECSTEPGCVHGLSLPSLSFTELRGWGGLHPIPLRALKAQIGDLRQMNKLLFLVSGFAFAAAYFVVSNRQQASIAPVPVADLAHKLQDAWADHHTVV